MVDTASCLLVAFRRKNCVKVRVLPPEPIFYQKWLTNINRSVIVSNNMRKGILNMFKTDTTFIICWCPIANGGAMS